MSGNNAERSKTTGNPCEGKLQARFGWGALEIWSCFCLGLFLFLSPFAYAGDEPVRDGSRAVINLNGDWQVRPIKGIAFSYPPPADGWKTEKIPDGGGSTSSINSIGGHYTPSLNELLNKEGTDYLQKDKMAAWFKREIFVPKNLVEQKRAILYFQGMAFKSEVWFNGTKLGVSYLGQVPIEYDVTELLKPDIKNEIVVGLAGREALVDIENKTYIAPATGTQAGIWGNVELRFLPETYIEDIFVKTSVKNRQIDLDVTLVNKGKNNKQVLIGALIADKVGVPQCNIKEMEITLGAGEKKIITLSKDWVAPQLWTPETPALYFAEVTINRGKELIDKERARFGFREFSIQGYDFYLNGVKVVLRRTSKLSGLGADYASFVTSQTMRAGIPLRGEAGRGYNCIRLHLGFDNELILDAADEFGIMAMPESAWHNIGENFKIAKSELWLPNLLAYEKALIKLHRNRPSVIIWSLTNETFWGETDSARMAIADKILAAAKEMDPTRPQQGDGESSWGKRLPIINIHYPLSTAGALRKDYPNSSYIIPNDLYWLSKKGVNSSWRANFEWDRPLIIGEYWWAVGEIDDKSSFMGEPGYDWEKWRFQDFGGRDSYPGNEYTDALKMMTDVYRMAGVAGFNPWSGNIEEIMPAVAVRPIDFHPNFFGGTTGVRKVVVFNDDVHDFYQMNLQCLLVIDGKSVWNKIIMIAVPPGQFKVVDIPIEFPSVSAQAEGHLTVRLRMWSAGGYHQINRHEEDVFIMPAENWSDVDKSAIVLLDSTGQTTKGFEKLGLKLEPKSALKPEDLKDPGILIVGQGTNPTIFKNAILAFARNGGRVIILRQDSWVPLTSELPEIDEKHVATRSWKRYYDHPITSGLDDRQFSYWQPDNLVSLKTFYKPSVGKFKVLLDSGGLYGLKWSPLMEVPYGKGVFLLSQLNLVDRTAIEPVAGKLLREMLRYCQNFQAEPGSPLRVLAGTNDSLKQTLKACGVVTESGLSGSGTGPILIDSSDTLSNEQLLEVKTYLEAGGKVWLHGFSPETISKISVLLPFHPEMANYDQTVQSAVRRSNDHLMNNLSSFDFFWTRINIGARADFFQGGQPTAKLGGYVLNLPSLKSGENLVEPALLVKIPAGKGIILFDTLCWESAFGAESDRVARIVSSIAANLGADIQLTPEKNYAYFQVDLSKQANMGFYDEVAGDGRGGWTDQGENDMRFFLINHTGKSGGMDVAVGEFPAAVSFANRPFVLINPQKNSGRSVITLRGKDHGPNLPEKILGIRVDKRANKLWFLQTAAWAIEKKVHQEVAHYVINYQNSRKVVFPLRYALEISDWWDPQPLSGAKVAWTGKNPAHSPVGIYATEWENPYPEETITSVDLIGNLTQTQIILLAITGGVEEGSSPADLTLISEWNLADVKNGIIPNRIEGKGSLKFSKLAPSLVEMQGMTTLRFRDGQSLIGNTQEVPELGKGKPFVLDVVFVPEEKPSGYYGGIFQSMSYQKGGFRMFLNQQMNLGVEIFTGENQSTFLKGKTPLTMGRLYKARLKFDGTRGYLFLNDKLDGSIDTPPPAPAIGEILIGVSSGKDYYFNGLISEIKVFTIHQD